MTAEERARKTIREWHDNEQALLRDRPAVTFAEWSTRLEERFTQSLRDQIEECATVADEEATRWDKHSIGELASSTVADKIRALAAPEGKIEQTYKEHSITLAKPNGFVTNLDDLRKFWGDEAVDRGLADGTIRFIAEDDESES